MSEQLSKNQSAVSPEDDELRKWSDEHHRYEARLAELAGKQLLSPDEEVEEKLLKKRKLFLKDQMAARLRGREH
ncbi:MAG TPA: DUF465 domain-containing protein [Thermoanaerobaculia bacterium]|nr:DUF465 domain-containing protein [Thermoanaerobaculia bacterium]